MAKFKKGECPNPGGRPKGVRALAKEACKKHGVHPLEYFAELLANIKASDRDRTVAGKELLDRMYGKAPQHVTAESTIEVKDRISEEVSNVLDKLKEK